jgi:hypothetical protein
MQPSDADSLFQESHHKRKSEEIAGEQNDLEETKTRCPCPICGGSFLEEDINNHLDICLNRSAVLELVRETGKLPSKMTVQGKFAPSARKRRR